MRLIDADALLNNIHRAVYPSDLATTIAVGICESHVKDMPTVDAAPVVHGRFLGTEYDGYADGNPVYYEWMCSECGCIFEDDEPTYNYCPNCGAKMDGGDKDDE